MLSLGSTALLLSGSAALSNEHLGALQHHCVGSPRHATIHRRGSRRTTARPRTTVCGGSTASLGNAARRPGYSRKTVGQQHRVRARGPEPNKPCQPSGTHPCAAGHGSSGARGCSGSPPRQHLPARRSALAPGVRRSARYTKAGRNEQGLKLCEPAAPAAVRGPTHPSHSPGPRQGQPITPQSRGQHSTTPRKR